MATQAPHVLSPLAQQLSAALTEHNDQIVFDNDRLLLWRDALSQSPRVNRGTLATEIVALACKVRRVAGTGATIIAELSGLAAELMLTAQEAADPERHRVKQARFQRMLDEKNEKKAPVFGAQAPSGAVTVASLGACIDLPRPRGLRSAGSVNARSPVKRRGVIPATARD